MSAELAFVAQPNNGTCVSEVNRSGNTPMKFASLVIICALGLSLSACESLQTNGGAAGDPGSFKGDLNNLGGPALNAPGMPAPAAQ
jgi:hypothetical protein